MKKLINGEVIDMTPEEELAHTSAQPTVGPRILRDHEFRNRFTDTQLVGIMRYALSGDDNAALVWLKLTTASDGVDLNDQSTIDGVQYIAAMYPDLQIDPVVILQ